VEGCVILGSAQTRQQMLSRLRRLAAFMGIRILAYILMRTHFHLLLEVNDSKPLSLKKVLRRIRAYYGAGRVQELLEQVKGIGDLAERKKRLEQLLEPFRARMNDLSIFMKELKGGFAQWYNQSHGRTGVLWAERFKSVLLEAGYAVAAAATYIDLNPVRAGLCTDPKDYGYCGYAEALARGSPEDQENLRIILDLPETTSWEELSREYHKHLFETEALASESLAVFGPDQVEKDVDQENGERKAADLWRGRVRYFRDGVILGSRAFVQFHLERLKEKLSYKRKRGPVATEIFPRADLWAFRKMRAQKSGEDVSIRLQTPESPTQNSQAPQNQML